jgi:hypothetical protein
MMRLEERVTVLEERMCAATVFVLGQDAFRDEIRVEKRWRAGKAAWVVARHSFLLTEDGGWLYESLIKKDDDEFCAATRFSLEQAWALGKELVHD